MGETDVTGTEGVLESRHVAQPGAEEGLEEETEVHDGVAHALGAEGQPPGLTDEKISPLDDDDGDEVGTLGVAEGLLLDHSRGNIGARDVAGSPGVGGAVHESSVSAGSLPAGHVEVSVENGAAAGSLVGVSVAEGGSLVGLLLGDGGTSARRCR